MKLVRTLRLPLIASYSISQLKCNNGNVKMQNKQQNQELQLKQTQERQLKQQAEKAPKPPRVKKQKPQQKEQFFDAVQYL